MIPRANTRWKQDGLSELQEERRKRAWAEEQRRMDQDPMYVILYGALAFAVWAFVGIAWYWF